MQSPNDPRGQAVRYGGRVLHYEVERSRFPLELASRFVPTSFDSATRSWIDDVLQNPHGPAAMAALALAKRFMSDYDANGLVGAHDMRVLGTDQWRTLLGDPQHPVGALLDVGAGEGQVTDELAPLATTVVTTELSNSMVRHLKERGYPCHAVDLSSEALPGPLQSFALVCALNVIDRTSRPYALVTRLGKLLAPQGRLICSAPLPLSPHVHVGPMTVAPEEILPKANAPTWENAATQLAELFFPACGLEVVAFTRAPYLCRGTKRDPLIALDDAIFVCAAAR